MFKKGKTISDIERKMYEKEIKRLTKERDEYANKLEQALKYQKDYEELRDDYIEKKKKQEELIKRTNALVKEIEGYRDSLEIGKKK